MDTTLDLLLLVFLYNEHWILREIADYFICMFHTRRYDFLQKVSQLTIFT